VEDIEMAATRLMLVVGLCLASVPARGEAVGQADVVTGDAQKEDAVKEQAQNWLNQPVTLALVTGGISLFTAIVVVAVQQLLGLSAQMRETRQYPGQVLFDKQMECYEKLVDLLAGIEVYISSAEASSDEPSWHIQLTGHEGAHLRLHELIRQYGVYLPMRVLIAATRLFVRCCSLAEAPTEENAKLSRADLRSLDDEIRTCMGVDKISQEFLQAFGEAERAASSVPREEATFTGVVQGLAKTLSALREHVKGIEESLASAGAKSAGPEAERSSEEEIARLKAESEETQSKIQDVIKLMEAMDKWGRDNPPPDTADEQ